MSPHYLVKNNKSDAAGRIVDHTHINRLLSEPPMYYSLQVNWTLQTRHTVDRNDVDTHFVMYRRSNTFVL